MVQLSARWQKCPACPAVFLWGPRGPSGQERDPGRGQELEPQGCAEGNGVRGSGGGLRLDLRTGLAVGDLAEQSLS